MPTFQPTEHAWLVDILAAEYDVLTDALAQLHDVDFYRPTRCRGLAIADLLVHVRLDAARALTAVVTPADPPADRDAVSYWHEFTRPDDDEAYRDARFLRLAASAYDVPSRGLLGHWRHSTEAAVRGLRAAPAGGHISTQGHVLALPDFVATLIVEATVHHLDLQPGLPSGLTPMDEALQVVTTTLDGLLGTPAIPLTGWDAETYAVVGCGREPLSDTDRRRLGPLAERFPLLG